MFRLVFTISCIYFVFAVKQYNKFLSDDYIASLNKKQSSWTAGKNFADDEKMMSVVRKLVSTVPRDQSLLMRYSDAHYIDDNTTVLPLSFDAREEWPNCTTIGQIWDQGVCSTGWAISAASVLSDRLCIKSNQTINPSLSPEDLLSCCTKCRFGCDGGYPNFAWDYMNESGIVTGGSYQSNTGCKSYSVPPCGHFNESSQGTICQNAEPACISTCYDSCDFAATKKNASMMYENNIFYSESGYMVYPEERQVKLEIMENGPVQATFDVFEDFLSYKTGVYFWDEDSEFIGEQSVKLIGWGIDENDQAYWLAVNSWNTDWGDNGLFKWLVNSTVSPMETEVHAAIPIWTPSDPDQPDEPSDNSGVRHVGMFDVLISTLTLQYVLSCIFL